MLCAYFPALSVNEEGGGVTYLFLQVEVPL